METQNPHDQFFKETLAQPGAASDFLRYYLPENFVRLIKPETVERIEDSFVDEELKEHLSDLLLRVELKTEGEAFVYVLLEHKSSPDKWVALQLLRYLVRIWEKSKFEKSKKLPLVFPVVFYHGRTKWRVAKEFSALLDFTSKTEELNEYLPEFEYHLCDLSEFADEDLQGEAQLQAAMRLLKYIFRTDLHSQMEAAFRIVMEQLPDATLKDRIIVFINYLLKSGKATQKEVGRAIKEVNETKGDEIMKTAYDEIIDVGLKRGSQQIVLSLLGKKFDKIDNPTEAAVKRLSTEKLKELGLALFDFQTREDLTVWLDENADDLSLK